MSAQIREPLPYPHHRGRMDQGFPAACTVGEHPGVPVMYDKRCPGCLAVAMVRAVHDPTAMVRRNHSGMTVSRVQTLRESLDDFDPRRVHFERALAERGIA